MNLVYIDEFLTAKGLELPSLAVLNSTADRYDAMLLQPDSEIVGNNEFIGNADQVGANKKHLSFFKLAKEKAAHLVITPEYSTPWVTVGALIEQSVLPSPDSLWVIGCEAITPDALNSFRSKYPNVEWIVSNIPASGTRTFHDPAVYLFNTRATAGGSKFVGVVQFKTQEMADPVLFLERDCLIKGETVYILRNNESSTYLFTIVCSDALSFTPALLKNREHPHLILHIQLNPNPRHPAIREYRKNLFHTKSDNKEVLCLNWAKDIHIQGQETPLNNISGSAYYTKSSELDQRDATTISNHNQGLYLTNWQSSRGHVFFLNHNESVFYYSTTRPTQNDAPPETALRTGPQMISTFSWDETNALWKERCAACESGLEELCGQFDLIELKNTATAGNPLDFERLITLSCGLIRGQKWDHAPDALQLFEIEDDEVISRVAFCQDPHEDACRFRARVLNHLKTLKVILTDKTQFPITIKDLAGNCALKYSHTAAPSNLFSNGTGTPAFVAFIGHEMGPEDRQKLYDTMVTFASSQDSSRRRVVLWYQDGTTISKKYAQTPPTLAQDLTESPQSIMKGDI